MATAKTPAKSAAKGKKPAGPKPGEYPGKIVDIDVSKEVSDSFLEYAYSVIYSRALPDARDGLKPVHRRILHQMADMGLRPERGHVKSARVVGEVMGKLHPHGDGAIYDALVRMAQSFSMGLPLIDGHGNFGSLDAGPAAMRYTEARLAPAAMSMVAEADEDTVDFGPNYDGQLSEPVVLPAAYPNLLVNGGSGIAVGMATNMAPHNLGEVIAATKFLIENPSATIKQLMKFIPGPDFPTGGEIVGLDGVREAYATGKGSFKVRASVEIEKVSTRKMGIVIKELPYTIGPEKVVERIAALVKAKKIQGISDIIDLSDGQTGTNVVIEIKNGFEPEEVLEMETRLAGGDVVLDPGPSADGEDSFGPITYLSDARFEPTNVIESAERDHLAHDGVAAALNQLDDRAKRIVTERWLKVNDDGSGGMTLHDLADEFGVSAERIRQIEAAALKKMRLALSN